MLYVPFNASIAKHAKLTTSRHEHRNKYLAHDCPKVVGTAGDYWRDDIATLARPEDLCCGIY